jgi:hypothetical protein
MFISKRKYDEVIEHARTVAQLETIEKFKKAEAERLAKEPPKLKYIVNYSVDYIAGGAIATVDRCFQYESIDRALAALNSLKESNCIDLPARNSSEIWDDNTKVEGHFEFNVPTEQVIFRDMWIEVENE